MEGRAGLPPGTVLDGSYRIVRTIGAGGFGITYEAEDNELRAKVAIKEYFPAEFGDRNETMGVQPRTHGHRQMFEWGRSRFLEEAQTLVRFKHPSIVRVSRIFRANATAYMVMDFEEGQSFEMWLRRLGRAPTQEELDKIVTPLLGAIGIMHGANFLHRDIAPDNIIIRRDGTPVLLDFGAARQAAAAQSRALTGIVKAAYSPHEQYSSDGRLQGPWTDLYAFGATLYRAITGRPPDDAPIRVTDDQVLPAAQTAVGRYRGQFLSAIDACLRVQPSQRPQSVAALRSMLLGAGKAPETSIVSQTLGSGALSRVAATAEHFRWHSLATAVVLVLLGAAYAGYLFLVRTGTEGHRTADAQERMPERARSEEAKAMPKSDGPCDGVVALVGNSRRCLKAKDTFKDCPECPEMVVVPAGSFIMGSPTSEYDRQNAEGPQRTVTLAKPIAVGKFEVTFAEWDACIAANGCKHRPSDEGWGRGKRPVINVSWRDATGEFVPWLSRKTGNTYRLLTEAEWEYAARAGTTTPFSTGQTITSNQANFDARRPYRGSPEVRLAPEARGEYLQRTVEVGSFRPNAFGLYDMHGNVNEWVEDCYNAPTYEGAPTDGSAVPSSDCGYLIFRGGGWYNGAKSVRSAARYGFQPNMRINYVGFRLARALGP